MWNFCFTFLLEAEAVAVIAFSGQSTVLRLTYAAVLTFIMLAAYFNLKHLLIRDVEGGIIKSIRGYNLLALLLELLYAAEILFDSFNMYKPKSIVYLLMSLCLIAIIPVLRKEITSWKVHQKEALRAAVGNNKPGGAA